MGPVGLLAVPFIAVLFGGTIWPGLSRWRLLLVGAATVCALLGVYGVAVFWFYGLGAPSGAWGWAGPLAAVLVYIAGSAWQARPHPWRWPAVAACSMLAMAGVGATAQLLGVRFAS
jgi:hypothetical protein